MPAIVLYLGGLLLQLVGSFAGRAMLALGFSYVTYKGFDAGITLLLTQIKSNMSGLPADVLSFMGWLWVDKAIGMLFSAYTAALLIKTAGGASFTKMITKAP